MLRGIIALIQQKRNSNEAGCFLWKIYKKLRSRKRGFRKRYRKWRIPVIRTWHHLKYGPILRRLIKNQKILIIGSGPSAAELEGIPEDVKIFTCNRGLKLFIDKKFINKVDLFLCYKYAMAKNYQNIQNLLPLVKTKIFGIDDVRYIKRDKMLKGAYSRLIAHYIGRDNYYLKKLIEPAEIKYRKKTSTGIALLQYAIYFGAKEIYLIGIDLSEGGYYWGAKNRHKHLTADHYFFKAVSEKYPNIYSLSKNSPITRFVPYKTFCENK